MFCVLTVSRSTSGDEEMGGSWSQDSGRPCSPPQRQRCGSALLSGTAPWKGWQAAVGWPGPHPSCPSSSVCALNLLSLLSFPNLLSEKRSLPWTAPSICRALCFSPRDQLTVAAMTLSPFKGSLLLRECRSPGSRAKPRHMARHLPSASRLGGSACGHGSLGRALGGMHHSPIHSFSKCPQTPLCSGTLPRHRVF